MGAEKFVTNYYANATEYPISSTEFTNAGKRNIPPFKPEEIRGGIGSARRSQKLPPPTRHKINGKFINFF